MVEHVDQVGGAGHDPPEPEAVDRRPASSQSAALDLDSREQLSRLQGLFAMAQLMAESRDEERLLPLAGSSVASFGPFRLLGIHLGEAGWSSHAGGTASSEVRAEVERQLTGVSLGGGPLVVPGQSWVWAYALRSLDGLMGHLAIASDSEPTAWQHFVLGLLAQQTAVALANARLSARRRTQAAELQVANSSLAATVAALERGTAIHDRLTRIAASGEGEEGIARTLHDLTGWPVAIEDRYGNLRAWGGPGRPDPYPKSSQQVREDVIRRAIAAGGPIQEGNRLFAIASPRADIVGVIVLVGLPPGEAEWAQVALEHAATVLAMELARLQSVAETELRLGRDLVEELLANTDEQAAITRAQALGYDLRRRHRVAIVEEDHPRRHDPDTRFHAVRRAARDAAVGTLLVPRGDAVVVLSHAEGAWDRFVNHLQSELGSDPWVGVGGPCEELRDFRRSYHEARLALRMHTAGAGAGRRVILYDQLGTYRLLAEVSELSAVDRFVDEWIGALLAYDSVRGADLVRTLSAYLEARGSYDTTAAALFVHRNTLKYRLRRIKEVSGHNLKDPDTLFNLQLATRAHSTRQALQRIGGGEDSH